MECTIYDSIDDIGAERLAPLEGSPIDFSYGLLRAIERTVWGDLKIRYLAIEEGGTLLSFLPVNVGTNIAFTAAMPRVVQAAYPALLDGVGLAAAYRIMVAGSLISDCGFIPLHPDCDRDAVVDRLIRELDALCRAEKVQVCFVKDVNEHFPGIGRLRAGGFVECFSLPVVRANTRFDSGEAYIQSLSANGRSHARRALKKAKKTFNLRVVTDFEPLIPDVYHLFRATYLKAEFKLEELPPQFFVECARAHPPSAEMILCERGSRVVGAYLCLFNEKQRLNKRVGIDYSDKESPAIYNILNYHALIRAAEAGIPVSYLGQTAYTPKVRMGGEIDDQFLFIKGYDLGVKLSLPLQKAWMNRYRADEVRRQMEEVRRRMEAESASAAAQKGEVES
jgi:hypothetical protein